MDWPDARLRAERRPEVEDLGDAGFVGVAHAHGGARPAGPGEGVGLDRRGLQHGVRGARGVAQRDAARAELVAAVGPADDEAVLGERLQDGVAGRAGHVDHARQLRHRERGGRVAREVTEQVTGAADGRRRADGHALIPSSRQPLPMTTCLTCWNARIPGTPRSRPMPLCL